MTADIAALDRLIEAVEAGDGVAFRRCNRVVFSTPCQDIDLQLREGNCHYAFRGSLDAAKALHEALLPDLIWEITPLGNCYIRDKSFSAISHAVYPGCPSRAWLLAQLRAHRARIGGAQ